MEITFYKNCILTNSYNEVFDVFNKNQQGETGFDIYLKSLENSGPIDFPDTYYFSNGKLSLDIKYTTYIYDYNYMKIEETGYTTNHIPYSLLRYCFIDNINIINGEAILSYSEDIWHTYAKDMNLRESLLINCKDIYGRLGLKDLHYRLPIEFVSNLPPIYKKADNTTINTSTKVCAIVTLQLFTLTEQGVQNSRYCINCLLSYNSNLSIFFNKQLLDNLQDIIKDSSTKLLYQTKTTSIERNFEVTSIKIIPIEFGIDKLFISSKANTEWSIKEGNTKISLFEIALPEGDVYGSINQLLEAEIKEQRINAPILLPDYNKFKTISIGTFTSQFKLKWGTKDNLYYKLYYSFNQFEFNLYFGINGNIYDITKDFEFDFPIDSESASSTQLKSIKRLIGNKQLNIEKGRIALSGEARFSKIISGNVNGLVDLANNSLNRELLNAEAYTSNTSSENFEIPSVNVMYGICTRGIEPINNDEVSGAVEELGYEINQKVGNSIFFNTPENANREDVLRFGFVRLSGKFPQDICNKLKEILLNGFKIYNTGVN